MKFNFRLTKAGGVDYAKTNTDCFQLITFNFSNKQRNKLFLLSSSFTQKTWRVFDAIYLLLKHNTAGGKWFPPLPN